MIVIIKLIDAGRASIIPEGGGPELYESETLTSAQANKPVSRCAFISLCFRLVDMMHLASEAPPLMPRNDGL